MTSFKTYWHFDEPKDFIVDYKNGNELFLKDIKYIYYSDSWHHVRFRDQHGEETVVGFHEMNNYWPVLKNGEL